MFLDQELRASGEPQRRNFNYDVFALRVYLEKKFPNDDEDCVDE